MTRLAIDIALGVVLGLLCVLFASAAGEIVEIVGAG